MQAVQERQEESVHALCKEVAGEHRLCLGTGGGPARSLLVRLRGWTNADSHCLIKKRKEIKPSGWKKPHDCRSWCSSGTSTTPVGQKGNRAGCKQSRRLLEHVGDNLFVLIINETGDAPLDVLLRNKEELAGGVKVEISLYNSNSTIWWWSLTS